MPHLTDRSSPSKRHRGLRHRALYAPGQTCYERRRSVAVLVVLLLFWSLCLGLGLAQATEPRPVASSATATLAIATVDEVPERYKFGQQLYLENCATCHVALPPAIMPSQTWKQLIQDAEHYGATIRPLGNPEVQIAWQYLRDFSRPLSNEEPIPYRIYQSRFFKALHPRVKFTQRINLDSCLSCHPGAGKYDFRALSSEWQNAP